MKSSSEKTGKFENFGTKVLEIVPQIHPYVKHRLYMAESTGIVPRNMYKTSGLIDDAILKLFEDYSLMDITDYDLKLKLFSFVSQRLDELFTTEDFHKKTLSISKILDQELEKLDERFEMDLDSDLLMSDELDDISYKQNDMNKAAILYSDAEKNIIKTLEVVDDRGDLSENKRKALNRVYNWLPIETSNILDLLVFGKLSYSEIASIKEVSTEEVKRTIQAVSKNFRKNLN